MWLNDGMKGSSTQVEEVRGGEGGGLGSPWGC